MLANSRGAATLLISAVIVGTIAPTVQTGAPSSVTVVDSEAVPGAGDTMVFSVGRNATYVMSMNFVEGAEGQAVTHRLHEDGSTTFVGQTPAGRENRAVALARGGKYAVIANSLDDEVFVMSLGDDGVARPVGTFSSGGDNPYDLAVGFNEIVVVSNRGSGQVNTFHLDRRGRLRPLHVMDAGIDPHVVAVSSRGIVSPPPPPGIGPSAVGERAVLVAVGNQTSQSISLFRMNREGVLTSLGDIPLGKAPRAVSWLGQTLFVALDEPGPPLPGTPEDTIRAFQIGFDGTVAQGPDTPAGHFLTDIEATKKGLFAVTVNQNGADPDRDEVRVYTIDGVNLTLDASVQPNDAFPSFKQVATIKGTKPVDQHVLVTEFQAGVLRSLLYDKRR